MRSTPLVRIFVAYLLSLVFAVGYGYVAAYNPRAEAFMIAMLDILQSIPVLSFLPSVMLAMVSLIPGRQLGIELGAIVLIFTGQVWNMAFSFYSSLKSLPRELARGHQRLPVFCMASGSGKLELPYSAIGLVWEFDGIGRRWLVFFFDGVRDVCLWAIVIFACLVWDRFYRQRPAPAIPMACCGDR